MDFYDYFPLILIGVIFFVALIINVFHKPPPIITERVSLTIWFNDGTIIRKDIIKKEDEKIWILIKEGMPCLVVGYHDGYCIYLASNVKTFESYFK